MTEKFNFDLDIDIPWADPKIQADYEAALGAFLVQFNRIGRPGELEEIGRQLQDAPDAQISLSDPDARAMATGSDHRGVVGYNIQAAVDTKHHIVVANAVTNRGHDRSHLLEMVKAAQAEIGATGMIAIADRGYYEGEQIRSCAEAGIIPMVPRPNTSPAQARGLWGKPSFTYEPDTDTYRCPVGAQLQKRHATVEAGKLIKVYYNQTACGACPCPFAVHDRQGKAHKAMAARNCSR